MTDWVSGGIWHRSAGLGGCGRETGRMWIGMAIKRIGRMETENRINSAQVKGAVETVRDCRSFGTLVRPSGIEAD